MKKSVLLLLLFLFAIGCSTQQSLLEGIVLFEETLPEPGSVSFIDEAGATATTSAYPGFIYLYARINTDKKSVESAVTTAQGTIVSAIPKAGIYMVKVESGQESAFINAMRQQSWVMESYPAFITSTATVHLFDFFSMMRPPDDCFEDHGELTQTIANSYSPGSLGYEMNLMPTSTDYLAKMLRLMEEPGRENEPKIFSLSIGSSAEDNVTDEEIRAGCHTINCQTARDEQKIFLRGFLHLLEAEIIFNPAAADKTMVILAMGNAGLDLDIEIKELKEAYPNAFSRIKLVGSSTPDGEITHRRNYASDPNNNEVVYAQGEAKRIAVPGDGEIICSGTSFSTPEISGILDYIWSQNPKLTSEQVMKAFDQALADYKTMVVPHNRNGKTDQGFIDRLMEIVSGMEKKTVQTESKKAVSEGPAKCTSPFDGRWTGTFDAELTYAWLANEPKEIKKYEGTKTESLTVAFTLSCVELVKPENSYADYPNGYYMIELSDFSSDYPKFNCANGCDISSSMWLPDGTNVNWIYIGLGSTPGTYTKMTGIPIIFGGDNQAVNTFLSVGETTTVNSNTISLSTIWSEDNPTAIDAWSIHDKGMNLLLCQKEDLNPENQWYAGCKRRAYSYTLRKQ